MSDSPDSGEESAGTPDTGPSYPECQYPGCAELNRGPGQAAAAKALAEDEDIPGPDLDEPIPKLDKAAAAKAIHKAKRAPGPDPGPRRMVHEVDQPEDGASGERGDSRTVDDGHAPGDGQSGADRRLVVSAEDAEKTFRDTIRDVRLVYDFGTKKVVGVAQWQADSWSWQITRLESPAENAGRQAAINLLIDLVVQAADYVAAVPTDLDEAVRVAAAVTDPNSIALKLCNAAGQALAHHLGLGLMAPALGSLVEQTLRPKVDPTGGQPGVVQALGVFDVTVDVAIGELTPAVYGFAAAELDSMLQDKTRGISQAELDKIQAAIKRRSLG